MIMNPIEKFRDAVTNAISAATAAGAEPGQVRQVLFRLASLDTAAASDAAENLDGLIDGNDEDDLGTQLAPALNILRQIASHEGETR